MKNRLKILTPCAIHGVHHKAGVVVMCSDADARVLLLNKQAERTEEAVTQRK